MKHPPKGSERDIRLGWSWAPAPDQRPPNGLLNVPAWVAGSWPGSQASRRQLRAPNRVLHHLPFKTHTPDEPRATLPLQTLHPLGPREGRCSLCSKAALHPVLSCFLPRMWAVAGLEGEDVFWAKPFWAKKNVFICSLGLPGRMLGGDQRGRFRGLWDAWTLVGSEGGSSTDLCR